MIEILKNAIVAGALTVGAMLGIYQAPQSAPISFGTDTVLPIAGTTYTLAGGGISSSATSITLSSFTLPQNGYKVQDADMSDIFYLTLEPGNRSRQEIVSCTTVTQNLAGTATLSGCTRGLSPITPYTASSSLQFAHSGGSQVIFSDPPQLFTQFTAKANDETITGQWTFDLFPVTPDNSPCSETVAGVCELATGAEAAAGTLSGGIGRLALPTAISTSTYNSATAANIVPVTGGTGILDPKFIFNGLSLTFPSTQGASSTVLANNGSGALTWNSYNRLLPVATPTGSVITAASSTIFQATIPANTLSTNNILHVRVEGINATAMGGEDHFFEASYGGTATATISVIYSGPADFISTQPLDFYVYANGATNAQKFFLSYAPTSTPITASSTSVTVDSTVAQPLYIRARIQNADSPIQSLFGGYVEVKHR